MGNIHAYTLHAFHKTPILQLPDSCIPIHDLVPGDWTFSLSKIPCCRKKKHALCTTRVELSDAHDLFQNLVPIRHHHRSCMLPAD